MSKRDHWDLWRLCFEWEDEKYKDGHAFDGTVYDVKPVGCDHIQIASIFCLSLVSITDDTELENRIVKPLKSF
ncbi:MAG TPA: hypothetical protein PK604_13920 [Acetivibrio clariflavus]|nr:hypothetical protein [Acetivibrio clariflavus]